MQLPFDKVAFRGYTNPVKPMAATERDLDVWLLTEGTTAVEVTAINPVNGKTKKLLPEDLREALRLLIRYDLALIERKNSPSPDKWEEVQGEALSNDFKELGLSRDWYDPLTPSPRPLFECRVGADAKFGHTLKELLQAVRSIGRSRLGLPIEEILVSPKEKLVFIADDDDDVREMMAFLFRKEGFQVDIFANGAEAVQAIHNILPDRAPDIIILDLMMPQQGGFETLRGLQQSDFPRIPIIIVTGHNLDRGTTETLRQEPNVVGFLAKPVPVASMVFTVHRVLKTKPLPTSVVS